MQKKRRKLNKFKKIYENCKYCENKSNPDYKDIDSLNNYVTERGKIISRQKTGVCSKHQRKLTRSIKRARHLALMPFIVQA